ncbi:tetratricopeptide repeat protein, partial [Acidisphaera sp. S103]|uniref:tetratricopeptide repeat protein n=1 Tax=Acidisphaera sp. S103 TaxID=1747223 RepID=UPI00131C456E
MRYLIALLGLALILPRPAAAQAYDWRPVNRDTAGMIRAGQYDAARPIIEGALANCPNAVTSVEAGLCTAIFSENLSGVLEHQGDLADAEADLRKTVETRASVLPANDPLVGQAYAFLAQFYQRHGRRADEIASLQAAEAIARAGDPNRRSELARLLGVHAAALTALGKPAEALPLYQEAYDVSREATGPTSRDTLVAVGNLFNSQITAGQADVAIDKLSTVLASPDVGNYDPTQRAMLAGLLALQTSTTPRSKTALGFVEAALPDLDAGLVDDANASYTLLWGAARLNAGVGDAKRAVEQARRARDIATKTWGADSHAVSAVLRTEADADAALHDAPAGIARLTEAAAMLSGPQYGFDRVQVELQRGKLLLGAGRGAEAVADHLAVLGSPVVTDAAPATRAALLVLLGEDLVRLRAFDPGTKACVQATDVAAHEPSVARDYAVRALLCSGDAAVAQDRTAEALDAATRAHAALWAGMTAPAEPNRVTQLLIADLRSRALRDSGRNLDALPAYREELALAQKAYDVVWQATAWGQIADLQRLMRLYKDSEQSSLSGLEVLGDQNVPRVRGELLNNRALLAQLQGQPGRAVPLFEASLAQRRADPVPEPMPLATGERDLAAALQTLGRNREAGRHMDVAIDGYRAQGEKRIAYLVYALNRRETIAVAAGDPVRAESALRELLALQDPASDDANTTRLSLAGLLDNQAHRDEAAGLRDAALASATAKHGADSAEAVRIRVTQLASLRVSGQLTEAELGGWQCQDRAKGKHDVLLPCLMARVETALAGGADRQAAAFGAQALVEAETHWTRDGGTVVQALYLQARIQAALGDADAVIRLYDRIHGLSPDQGISRSWTDYGEGALLTQAGETTVGPAMLRLALKQAKDAHNAALAVAATGGLAGALEKTGRWEEAMGLWQGVLP